VEGDRADNVESQKKKKKRKNQENKRRITKFSEKGSKKGGGSTKVQTSRSGRSLTSSSGSRQVPGEKTQMKKKSRKEKEKK